MGLWGGAVSDQEIERDQCNKRCGESNVYNSNYMDALQPHKVFYVIKIKKYHSFRTKK